MNRLDELENLKETAGEAMQTFLTQHGAGHLFNEGLFALLSQAMNDAWDCADTKEN